MTWFTNLRNWRYDRKVNKRVEANMRQRHDSILKRGTRLLLMLPIVLTIIAVASACYPCGGYKTECRYYRNPACQLVWVEAYCDGPIG